MRLSSILTSVVLCGFDLMYAAVAQTPPAIPKSVYETATAGVHRSYNGEWKYMVGGGIATFDCNNDDFPDLLLADGTSNANFFNNESKKGGTDRRKSNTDPSWSCGGYKSETHQTRRSGATNDLSAA